MFSAFDDPSLLGKKVAGFISGRGASAASVALAAPFVAAPQLPAIGLTVGLPIKAAVATMEHYHREDKILNDYREEIAAKAKIAPEDVTHDNLRALAFGNPKLGEKPQPFFEEILSKNDKNRWIEIGSHIAATVISIGFVFSPLAANIVGGIASMATASSIGILAAYPMVVGFVGLSIATTLVVSAIDYMISDVTKKEFGIAEKTAYDFTENLVKQQINKVEISTDKVMQVLTSINKGLKAEIVADYGANYSVLPEQSRREIVNKYDKLMHISEYADKINSGEMKANELAFIGAGDRSGVPERDSDANSLSKPSKSRGIIGQCKNLKQTIHEKQKENHEIRDAFRSGVVDSAATAAVSDDMPHAIDFNMSAFDALYQTETPNKRITPQSTSISAMQEQAMISNAIH